LDELKIDVSYCLGDTVGYGPFPNECVDLVRKHCSIVLKGNHDSGILGETSIEDFNQHGLKAILWSQKVITGQNLDYLRQLPFTSTLDHYTLAHASPYRPQRWTYVLTLRAAKENFRAFSTTICFIGHTHVPVIIGEDSTVNQFRKGPRFIINVGSVGQPRDGNPESAFGLYDTESDSYTLLRVPYDIDRTAKAINAAGLPPFLAQRLHQGI
jgi:diadenosine tetraphosphatase ApaH/serine/threonine PP2A family protein phosphatase